MSQKPCRSNYKLVEVSRYIQELKSEMKPVTIYFVFVLYTYTHQEIEGLKIIELAKH